MSTSLLYHGSGIRGYQYLKADFEGGKAAFTVPSFSFVHMLTLCLEKRVFIDFALQQACD